MLKYKLKLSPWDIVSAFPIDAAEYVPLYKKKLYREFMNYRKGYSQILNIRDKPSRILAYGILRMDMPKEKVDHYKNLCAMSKLMRVKSTDWSIYGRITPSDILFVKGIDISLIYNFKKKRKNNKGFSACCPFHSPDNIPSFSVKDNKWICFTGCGQGDSIDFVMKLYKKEFIDAVRFLLSIE